MSAPEPTAEHKRLAARLVDDIYDRGSVNPAECGAAEDLIARALAAAEARGAVVAVAGMIGMDPSLGWAAVKAAVADRLQDRRRALDEVAERVKAAEARGFERGQKTNPATVWGWAAAVGGDGWLLCPMVLRGDRLVVDANDVRGMIFGEPGREGYAAVRRLRASQYTKRVRRKTMEGARSALSKLMGESIPALPDSKEPR